MTVVLFGVPMALFFLVAAVVFRAGRWRSLAGWRNSEEMPLDIRNAVYGFVPGAAFILFFFLWLGFTAEGSDRVAWAMLALAAMSFILSMRFSRKPPQWLKPQWVREEEERRKEQIPEDERRLREPLVDRVIDGLMVLFALITLVLALIAMITG